MLKLGFKEDIEKILGFVRQQQGRDLQICLFSATMPGWVRDVANQHMKRDLKYVDLAKDLSNKSAKNIQHLAIETKWHNRVDALADCLIAYGGEGKTIVFTQTKADANSLMATDKIQQEI
jgi:superfamily II DNA/RNA helicase